MWVYVDKLIIQAKETHFGAELPGLYISLIHIIHLIISFACIVHMANVHVQRMI